MDQLLRGLVYLVLGLVLVACNLIYARALFSVKANRYTIMPVSVLGEAHDSGSLQDGIVLAQLLQARIQSIEQEIMRANENLTAEDSEAVGSLQSGGVPDDIISFIAPFGSVTLPTSVVSTPDINITVSGVEVTGLLRWFRSSFNETKRLRYAIYFKAGGERSLAAADLSAITGMAGGGNQWFESGLTVGETLSDLAYRTVQMQASSSRDSPIRALSLDEFRSLVTGIISVSKLNSRVQSGFIPEVPEYERVADEFEVLVEKVPRWPELNYMLAAVSERARRYDRAAELYRSVHSARSEASPELREAIEAGRIAASIGRVDILRSPGGMERYYRVDPAKSRALVQKALDEVWPEYETLFGFSLPRPEVQLLDDVNAYWNPADNKLFINPVVTMADVVYHEMAHPFVGEYLGTDPDEVKYLATAPGEESRDTIAEVELRALEFFALHENYANVLASWFKQKRVGQSAKEADWELATGFLAWASNDRTKLDEPLRSLREPRIWDYELIERTSSPHDASGVADKAFYEIAMSVGTERAIQLWVEALPKLGSHPSLRSLARATITSAEGANDPVFEKAVRQAWLVVNVWPESSSSALEDPLPEATGGLLPNATPD